MRQHSRIGGYVLSAVSPRTGIFAVRKGSFLPDFTASRLAPAEGWEENGSGEERFPSSDVVRKDPHEPKVLEKASRALEGIVAESFAGKQEGLVLKVAAGAASPDSLPLRAGYPVALSYPAGRDAKALPHHRVNGVLPSSMPVQPLWVVYAKPMGMSYTQYEEAQFRYDAEVASRVYVSPVADYQKQSGGTYPSSFTSYRVSSHLLYRKDMLASSEARQQEGARVEYAAQHYAASRRTFEPRQQDSNSGNAYRAEANELPSPIRMTAGAGKPTLPYRATANNIQFRHDAPKELRMGTEQRMRQGASFVRPIPPRRDDDAYLQRLARSEIAVPTQRIETSAYHHLLQTKPVKPYEPAQQREMPDYREMSVGQSYRVSSLEGRMTIPYISASLPSVTVIPAKSPAFALDFLVTGQPLRAELKNLDGLLKDTIPTEQRTTRDYEPRKGEQRKTYRDIDGSVVKDMHVALDYSIKESDMAGQGAKKDYLSFAKERLRQLGHNVDIETRTYNGVKARILVNKDNPNRYFHILINGKLPEFKDGGENPAALLYLEKGATLQIVEHGNVLPYIKAWDNPLVRQCTTGKNNYKK